MNSSGTWSMVTQVAMASSTLMPLATAAFRAALTARISFIRSPVRE